MTLKQKKILRVNERIKRNNLREAAFNNQIQISNSFENNPEIALMRVPFSKEFLRTYNSAFEQYVKGNWAVAKEGFEKVLTIIKGDKPTQNLLDFMAETNF